MVSSCSTGQGGTEPVAVSFASAVLPSMASAKILSLVSPNTDEIGGLGGVSHEPLLATVQRLPEVRRVAEELVEAGIDAFVGNAAIDAIPIVATVKALVRGAAGYHEAWLSKKLVAMLYGVGDVSEANVVRWTKRLRDDPGLRETGERVLAVVDRATSTWKAELIGRLLRSYLDGGCDRQAFLVTTEMVDAALTEDLRFLIEEWSEGMDSDAAQRLIGVGLMRDQASRLLTEDSEPPIPSHAGQILRLTLQGGT